MSENVWVDACGSDVLGGGVSDNDDDDDDDNDDDDSNSDDDDDDDDNSGSADDKSEEGSSIELDDLVKGLIPGKQRFPGRELVEQLMIKKTRDGVSASGVGLLVCACLPSHAACWT